MKSALPKMQYSIISITGTGSIPDKKEKIRKHNEIICSTTPNVYFHCTTNTITYLYNTRLPVLLQSQMKENARKLIMITFIYIVSFLLKLIHFRMENISKCHFNSIYSFECLWIHDIFCFCFWCVHK